MKTIYLHETVVILFEQLGVEKFAELGTLEQKITKTKPEIIYFILKES